MMPARQTLPAAIGALLAAGLPACATAPDAAKEEPDPAVEETYVYLDTVKPETVLSVRFTEPLRYDVVNVRFVYLDIDSGRYLVEMERDCRYLKSNAIFTDMADRRSMRGRLRANIDTIRGCRIENIYELPPLPETPADEAGQIPPSPEQDQEPR